MYRVTYLIIPSISVTSEHPSKHSSWWWRRFEDGLKTFFVFVFRRHLDQDEYVHLIHASSEDNLKTSWSRPIYSSWSYVFKTSSRRLQNILKMSSRHSQEVFKTSSRRLQDVLQKRLQDISKTSSRRLQDIFKTFSRCIIKLNCSWLHNFKTSSRRIQNVFKTYC